MASKRTGRPVGRPRKPKPRRRPRAGRPPLNFKDDPDRYAVALDDALLAFEMASERTCAAVLAQPMPMTTLAGRAAGLRGKQRRCRSAEEGAWRTVMASCFMLVLGARDQDCVKPVILARAESINEGDFARRVLLLMLAAKFAQTSVPEFSHNLISTNDGR
jgi:hypothetical protein